MNLSCSSEQTKQPEIFLPLDSDETKNQLSIVTTPQEPINLDVEQLTTVNIPRTQKEVKFFLPDKISNFNRLSTGSNMSTSSFDSENNNNTNSNQSPSSSLHQISLSPSSYNTNLGGLQPGICIKQSSITNKDVKIAAKAIEMIACFIENRKDCINQLTGIRMFNECIIDVLTGSSSSEIRTYMEKFLLKMCQVESAYRCKEYLLNLIVKARLPLWINSSFSRSSTQKLIVQSKQYFNLRSALMENMTIEEQSAYGIDLNKMLNDEVKWLVYFTPTKNLKDIDNILLSGHLELARALLTCETANKVRIYYKLLNVFYHKQKSEKYIKG